MRYRSVFPVILTTSCYLCTLVGPMTFKDSTSVPKVYIRPLAVVMLDGDPNIVLIGIQYLFDPNKSQLVSGLRKVKSVIDVHLIFWVGLKVVPYCPFRYMISLLFRVLGEYSRLFCNSNEITTNHHSTRFCYLS